MILVIDNYDSFTFNLVQALEAGGADLLVRRNDEVTVDDIKMLASDEASPLRGLLVSPGPSNPDNAGVSVKAIRIAGDLRIPTLGVCLGMQAIVAAFGGQIVRAPVLVHGSSSPVEHDERGLFAGLPTPFDGARYHSLCAEIASLPEELEISARALDDGVVMGVRHRDLPMEGIQFHPESLLTPMGPQLLANFLRACGEGVPDRLADAPSFALRGL